MKKTLLMLTLLLLAAPHATAQEVECHYDGPQRGNCKEPPPDTLFRAASRPEAAASIAVAVIGPRPTPPPAPGPVSSPIDPKTPTDHRFIINGAQGLDTGCTFRSGGPLRFQILIDRVVGDTDDKGKLTNPEALVDNVFKGGHVTLRMPAFDVDVQGGPPEVDEVYVNGELVGKLEGSNNVWNMNEFEIPIDKVHFGIKSSEGAKSTAGVNEIEIRIDQASGSAQNWCTSIDWAEMTFEALYPVVMVHGNSQDSDFWTDHRFVEPFEAQHIPFDASISMKPNAASIDKQSGQLVQFIRERAERFGVDHLHLVAHSKGGLDLRAFLVTRIPELRAQGTELGILSLSTLSTPHHGSVGADYVIDAKRISTLLINRSSNPEHTKIAYFIPTNEGYPDLRTDFVQNHFNVTNRPLPTAMTVKGERTPVRYFSFGADANANDTFDANDGQPTIEAAEVHGLYAVFGLFDISNIPGVPNLSQKIYRLMGNVSSTHIEPLFLGRLWVVREDLYSDGIFRRNDFLVTVDRSRYEGFTEVREFKGNHATIARPEVAESVINAIRSANGR